MVIITLMFCQSLGRAAMRCKACDSLLHDWDDPELCEPCLATIKDDYNDEVVDTRNEDEHVTESDSTDYEHDFLSIRSSDTD